jgi:CheY-like chemotaxis protein
MQRGGLQDTDGGARRILLVEDDLGLREIMTVLLQSEGYAVAGAGDGHAALSELRRELADVIVLDMAMPGMDGWAFLATKARIPIAAAIPVVVVSGAPPRGRPPGVVAWLEKPCAFDGLLRLLRPWGARAPADRGRS